jgi:uncharacterized membrane protein YeiH
MLDALPTSLEYVAIGVFAAGGVLAGKEKQIDLFGTSVLAVVSAFGGGTLRDILVGDVPVSWLRDPWHLLVAVGAAVLTFFYARYFRVPLSALAVADTIGLAAFVIVGTEKGVALGYAGPVCVFFGVITGTAGGIIRDVLLNELPRVFRHEIRLYASAAAIGATLYVWLQHWSLETATIVGVSSILIVRVIAVRWGLSLPIFKSKN